MLESLWEVVETIIDTRLRASVCLHDVLRGFHTVRGTGAAILELNLDQDLDIMDQDPLLLAFLNLSKDYDTVDRGRLLTTLEGYGAGPRMCRILEVFWDQQEVVTHQNGYHVPHFKENWGTTQGGLISPTLFNLIVNNTVKNWLSMTVEYQLVAYKRLGLDVGRCMGLLYADNIVLGSRDK